MEIGIEAAVEAIETGRETGDERDPAIKVVITDFGQDLFTGDAWRPAIQADDPLSVDQVDESRAAVRLTATLSSRRFNRVIRVKTTTGQKYLLGVSCPV